MPGAGGPYVFRAGPAGREHVVAICTSWPAPPDGIAYDWERQRFTELGDWRAFLARMPEPGSTDTRVPAPVASDPRQRRGRRVREPIEPSTAVRPAREAYWRTSIEIVIAH